MQHQEPGFLNLDRSGQSLILVLMMTAIVSILAAVTLNSITSSQRENRALAEKLASLDTLQIMGQVLTDGTVCDFELTDPSQATNRSQDFININNLGTANAPEITFKKMHYAPSSGSPSVLEVNKKPSLVSSTLIISKLLMTRFETSDVPNILLADIQAEFDASSLVRAIKPVSVRVAIYTDTTTPANARKIIGCTVVK